MTRRVGAAVHQCPYAVEYSCTGRTRKGHAATDAIGCYRFNGGRYESAARRRAGLSPPLQSVAGSLAQLSTIHFPLAFSFFSCSRRAGPSARAPSGSGPARQSASRGTGQSQLFSSGFHSSRQPRCGQRKVHGVVFRSSVARYTPICFPSSSAPGRRGRPASSSGCGDRRRGGRGRPRPCARRAAPSAATLARRAAAASTVGVEDRGVRVRRRRRSGPVSSSAAAMAFDMPHLRKPVAISTTAGPLRENRPIYGTPEAVMQSCADQCADLAARRGTAILRRLAQGGGSARRPGFRPVRCAPPLRSVTVPAVAAQRPCVRLRSP